MCPKTPKVKPVEEKTPQYMRNPFLDGLALGASKGRNSLRVELGSTSPSVPYQPSPGVVIPITPNSSLGFGGGTTGTNGRSTRVN
jgi:hypothetical protein